MNFTRVTTDPRQMGGLPCIRGLRIPVATIVEMIADGMSELIAFIGIAVLVIVTPGPDTALTVRNSLVGGRQDGVFTALGVSAGQAIWTLAASAGVSALLVASEPAFAMIKLAGAAYLIFLGGQALWVAWRSGR